MLCYVLARAGFAREAEGEGGGFHFYRSQKRYIYERTADRRDRRVSAHAPVPWGSSHALVCTAGALSTCH